MTICWKRDRRWSTAEHALVGDHHELVAFDLAPSEHFPARDCGYEIFGPPRRRTRIATAQSCSLAQAKADAEAAWHALQCLETGDDRIGRCPGLLH